MNCTRLSCCARSQLKFWSTPARPRLSNRTTWLPSRNKRSARLVPMKPLPPVIKAFTTPPVSRISALSANDFDALKPLLQLFPEFGDKNSATNAFESIPIQPGSISVSDQHLREE